MSKSVTILGAGVIGLSTALYCARRGMRVTIIDQKPRQRDGCSFGNAGMIVPSHFIPLAAPGMVALGLKWMWNPESPFYIKPRLDADLMSWGLHFWKAATKARVEAAAPVLRDLSLLSRECFETLGLDFGLVKRGLLMLCKKQQTLDEEAHMAEKANALGIPAEVLDAKATAALDPAVTMDICGSVFFPKDCHLAPGSFISAVEAELVRLGVTFLWETEVSGFKTESGALRALKTSRGEIESDEVVLSGGVWSAQLAKELDLKLPMQAGKGYSLTLANPTQLPELCSICTEARLAVTPMDGALRVGGTMEMAGIDESITQRRVRGITRAFPQYFPAFEEADFAEVKPWSGLRPVSPDGMPYIGRTKRWKNLTVATGHAMMGLSLAPATGRIVSELLADEKSSVKLDLMSPDRFA
ncbi:MAG: FAD-dependent oxidoreductase [Prosthecobacter sp.]|jgi:D-amino-acid dehydrogenase|uniref:NAD(P)/FAD-dependent oxidoreductase n=1 Tax=Prosthecobacter sp. TaxID=1965333 RepID=UPI0019E82505|nr:FAD-dependent oxidoreductase [Prosthecobacter sp.]MBE2283840.1 FAD-dependent oxidoreductase [Prosthecobacter sp.]